ncbi:LysR family transcriptional regulator [Roseibium sp. SCP14]|uniref:LysR family transcriptional regulator n=1 Tax=Roseibium sp. SCP14 TaxID=3141375 RepID=UPI0033378227
MDNWNEIRTAYHVARLGSVSGAAKVLGVHHATVIRHIDELEKTLGAKLFQRHSRGYTVTEAGQDLLQVAQATDDQFSQLGNRIKGRGGEVTGELVITSLAIASAAMTSLLARFQAMHPHLIVRFLTDPRLFRLEYGEAHVAIRAGSPSSQPDNVVQPFARQRFAIYASRAYISRNGMPQDENEIVSHRFVGSDDLTINSPMIAWLRDHVPEENLIFRATDMTVMREATLAGVGLCFLSVMEAASHPELVEVIPSKEDWVVPWWLLTHVDLHRTAKVQAVLSFLKEEAKKATVI